MFESPMCTSQSLMLGNNFDRIVQMGDATNMVLILAGELLKKAEHLLIMGLHPSEVIKGYELACKKALEELDSTLSSISSIHFSN